VEITREPHLGPSTRVDYFFAATRFFFPFPLPPLRFPVFGLAAVGLGAGVALEVGAAPRTRTRPSLRVSVTTGEAAGRYLNSLEYLRRG
jgi:hypothetical protein